MGFKVRNLETMIPIFYQRALKVCDKLQQAAENGTSVDLQDLFMRYTLDSFSEIGFGVDCNSLSHELTDEVPFAKCFDYAQKKIEHDFRNPLDRHRPNKEF